MKAPWRTWRRGTATERRLEAFRGLIAHTAASSAGTVQHVAGAARHDLAGWGTAFAGAVRATGGELSLCERRWAERVLGLAAAAQRPRPTGRPALRLIVS